MNYLDKFSLKSKVCLVTGGAGGIGEEICKALLDAGAKVILADIDEKKTYKLTKKLSSKHKNIYSYKLDATSLESIISLKNKLIKKFNKIDVLVNAIGICKNKDAAKVAKEEWDEVININVNSMFYLCREFGKIFIKRKSGCIVNIGSNSGLIVDRPQPQASYNASKAAVHQLTKSLACEWAKYNIRVNAVAPGYVATKMTLLGRSKPNWFKYWIDMTPMKRLAKPSEIASAVLFLSTDSSSYCTGTILSVDGGYTSW
tara:strand:- start:82 stop:855 length:774 start_codon:yes stop_codon:yes gene_type:complete